LVKNHKKLWIGLGVLILLSPLGIILPAHYNAGSSWGEWSPSELGRRVGYIPAGMQKQSNLWKAPLPDYALKGHEAAPVHSLSLSYLFSGVMGVGVIIFITILLGKVVAQRDKPDAS